MKQALSVDWMTNEQDRHISRAIEQERSRLLNFIRRRVIDDGDAEDILQDVFYELVEAYRLMKPIEQVGAWLFQVARNRIIDLFRKKKPEPITQDNENVRDVRLEDLLPSRDAGPEAAYAQALLLEELDAAIGELPDEQREVFVAHELEGISFQELSAQTGLSVNTLLSRKHYAVLHLRERLQAIHDEFTKK
jgi:RNA polymerase sigma factor (sigma-70 family)